MRVLLVSTYELGHQPINLASPAAALAAAGHEVRTVDASVEPWSEELVRWAEAAAAMGLSEGPVHAELRIDPDGRPWILELAARTIGGLCARTLRFAAGVTLEELVLRHALGLPIDPRRERLAAGVMMLPIPAAGRLTAVRGQEDARAVPHITALEISIPIGGQVRPLPEGDRYLGFLFARASNPAEVEEALRTAHSLLEIVID